MPTPDWSPFLAEVLRPRAGADGIRWLEDRGARLRGAQVRAALLEAFTGAARALGKRPLALTPAEQTRLAALDPELTPVQWTTADAGRAWLLLQAGDPALALAAYEEGDSAEQQSWLRALPLLPWPERYLAAAIDNCRTNILPQFEALACDNPYPARHFPDANFNQLVLKALFNSIPVARITGLERRLNADLSRMASDYASERRAAGRAVPADIGAVIQGAPR
jgi:hypothetical protein